MVKYLPHLVAVGWVLGFYGAVFIASKLFRPASSAQPGPKVAAVEGGPWIRMSSRYQALMALTALFFVGVTVFYPAAVVFRSQVEKGFGIGAFFEIALFLGTLAGAVAYVWKKGDLSWIQSKDGE